ncbi:putative Muscarinic acetylcholine receptor M3 [Hypsibius exemplaris]|uniref:Muscarinic acetylcholine receptor M3 n=1 Tax=Hypsibius exemplaris TaxID=2072580 RepID=A0A1W0WQ99_HYPEX|nr:putative Muscarinic acetylcholine receptor M3 [Hypsibius exemplaris]
MDQGNLTFADCSNGTNLSAYNSSLVCLNDTASNTTDDPGAYETWMLPFGASVFLIIDTVITLYWAITANLIVIVSFLIDPKLRIIQNYYIFSLACADLFNAAFVTSLGLYSFLYGGGWPMENRALCKIFLSLDYVLFLVSSQCICLISYDRYKMVLHPIAYRNEETPKRAMIRIFVAWLFAWLFYGPVTLFWDFAVGQSRYQPYECDSEFVDLVPLTIFQTVVEFGCPLAFLIFFNGKLLIYIKGRRNKMLAIRKRMQVTPTENTTVDSDSKVVAVATVEKAVKAAKKKDANANQTAEIKEIRKEQRATRSLMILVGTFLLLWLPYEVAANCKTFLSTEVYQATYWPLFHLCAVNPIIYACTIERFRYHFLTVYSYILPCWIRHPAKESAQRNKVAPLSGSNAAVHAPSDSHP